MKFPLESVAQSNGAALKAALFSERTELILGQGERKFIDVAGKPLKMGVFICGCEGEIADAVDLPTVVELVKQPKDVAAVNEEIATMKETLEAIESGM